MLKPIISQKCISYLPFKFGQVWWLTPIIPALREAEAGESLNLKRQRLHHCNPAWLTEQDSIAKKKSRSLIENRELNKNVTLFTQPHINVFSDSPL